MKINIVMCLAAQYLKKKEMELFVEIYYETEI